MYDLSQQCNLKVSACYKNKEVYDELSMESTKMREFTMTIDEVYDDLPWIARNIYGFKETFNL